MCDIPAREDISLKALPSFEVNSPKLLLRQLARPILFGVGLRVDHLLLLLESPDCARLSSTLRSVLRPDLLSRTRIHLQRYTVRSGLGYDH